MLNAKDWMWRNHHSPVETCRNNGSNYVSSHFKDIIFDVARVIMLPTGKNTIKQSSSATRKHIKPCHGWKKSGNSGHNFLLKKKLVSDLFDNRIKLYLLKSVNNMETHLKCSWLSPSRNVFLLLFQQDTLKFLVDRMNTIINYENSSSPDSSPSVSAFDMPSLMKWTAIHITSQQTSCSPSFTIDFFKALQLGNDVG